MTLLLVMLCTIGVWADQKPVSLSDDGEGGWFINMPAKGTATSVANAAVLTLTADDISAGKIPFKVYDDGGKDDYYSHGYSGYLIITAPEGYVPQLSGSVKTESCCDHMRVYNGTTTDKQLGVDYQGSMTVGPLRSNHQSMLIYFGSDGSVYDTGLDLTVELVDARNLDLASIVMPAYLPYTGSQIAINPSVTAFDGVVLTKDTHYTVTTSPSPVQEIGNYEMTITGIAPYYGTLNANFAVTANLEGDGTEAHPYLISNIADYNLFVSYINAGTAPYADNGKIYKLTANIGSELDPITTKVGEVDGAHFKGIFDGDGHTLYVNINDNEHSGTATFGYVEGATIKNLTVAGSVTGGIHAAALVGFSTGTNNLIQNCTVSVSVNGGSHIGGILGHGLSSDIAIENCIYSGLMTGGNNAKGAIFGWGDNGGTKSVTNCVYLKHDSQNTNNLDLVRKSGGDITVTNSYKTANTGSYGIYATGEVPVSGISKPITVLGVNLWVPVSVSGIESYYIYNGSVIPVLPTVTCVDNTLTLDTDYTIASTPAPIQATGNYTLTVTGINDYTGTDSKNFEVIQTFANGDGSEATPYLIENADDWNLFAQYMTEGRSTFLNKYYKLTSDITVTTMAGNSSSNCFKGVFDGDSHTMTLNLTATTENCAPFKYLSGATIKNLNIAGTVTTSSKLGASIAAHTYSTTNIQNCTSSVIITSTFESLADGTHAGFVAVNEGSATLNISNCVFTGKLLGANAYANGGFVGWNAGSKVNYTDCLFAPTEITMNELNSATFNRNGNNTFTNTYFLTQYGEAQGIHLATAAPANDVYKSETVTVRETNYYAVCDITGVKDTYYHTGSAIAVAPVVKLGSTTLTANTDYTVVIKNSSYETVDPEDLKDNGNYTITITGSGNYAGSRTIAFQIMTGEMIGGYFFETGTDDEGTYYKIATATDFDHLVACVNSADNTTKDKRFKQTANITVSSMMGTSEKRSFQGVYDGQGNTLTLDITATQNIAGPFRYIKNATIKNITIAGTINNSGKQNGGVAGYSYGNVTISNCIVSASITSGFNGDASNGGFIAHIQTGNVTFNNCVFTGRLLGESANSSACFVGWRDNTNIVITFNNCLVAPAEITMGVLNSATFNRNKTDNNIYTNCFYLTSYGEVQGAKVVTVAPASGVYKAVVAADANNYYALCDVTGVESVYLHTASAIAVEPVVKMGSETLTAATDYTVTFKNSSDETVVPEALIENGHYTVTVAGIGSCAGSETFNFRIVDGENLDGYAFETATDDEGSYYVIADESDLERLSAYVNSNHNAEGKRFKQTANIAFIGKHTAIGNNNYRFKGIYDGNNMVISNLVVNKPSDYYQGLFGYTDHATVKNVELDNCNITGSQNTGGIAGYAYYGSISNCTVSGIVQIATGSSAQYLGGIAGYSVDCPISESINHATVNGASCVGGISGYLNWATNTNNLNTGVVTGTSYVGSIVGYKGGAGYFKKNYYLAGLGLTGGVGSNNVATGTDQADAEVIFTVTAGENTQVTLPETPAKVYNEKNYYKNGTEVTLNYNVPTGKFFDQYTVSSGTITSPYVIDGKHILTGVTDNVTITGSYTDKMDVASNAVTVYCGIIPYTGDVITVAPIVERLGVTLVQGTDYTVTTTPAVVQAAGEYTLTITGKGDYTGTKQVTFYVKNANIIKNASEWADFAANVNAGTGNDDYYKLADDFDNTESAVTATVGTQEHPFTGLFDGNGKTLNVNINETSTQGTAPFREIAGATIKNLTVSGSVTGTTHASGLVGFTLSGVNYIDNCVVNTNVTCSTSGSRHIGGVVGHGIQSTVNISNTIYAGALSNNTYAGGLLGWSDGGKLNITNCLVTGSKNGSYFHPIAIKNNTAVMEVNVDGAFYTNDATLTDANHIAATGTKVYAGAQTAFCKKEWTLNETDYYSKETAVIGNVDNTIEYTGDVITVTPTVTYEGTALTADTDFTLATDPATIQETGEYTLTITGQGNYAGTQSMKFHVVAGILNGEGTEASPYLIASAADWNKFAGNINNGSYNYSGQFVQMTDDITVSTMAGNSEANSFQGTFLGTAGKTMTLDLTATDNDCAPFAYLKNATVKDVTIAGTISTGFKYGASIAAHTYGTTNIKNCVSTVEITSTFDESKDGTHGGFVALNEGATKLYFNNCVFAGKLLGANAYANGGFVGYCSGNSGTQVTYTDCLFAPAEITMDSKNSATFNRNGSKTFSRAYYLTAFGTTQSIIAYTSENVPATGLFGQITAADGNTYYVQGSVSNINASYACTGSAISINPTFSISNESVSFVKDTDFEVTITKDGNPVTEVNEIGDYVFTISGKDGGLCKGSTTKNVNVYPAKPTDFAWSLVTTSTATLTWNDDAAANWTVELSESSDFSTIVESQDVTAKTVTFEGLTADVEYYARVKAVYSEASSNWSSTLAIQPTTKFVIGSGTATSSVLPFHLWYHHNLTQQIYTPDELGNKAGSILSFDFYRTDNNSCKNSIEIYLVQTTKNSFENGTDWIPVTATDKVFAGKVNFSSNAWTTITLDTPFDYDGTSNLALIVYDPNVSGDDYGTRYFRVFSGASNQSIQYNSDNTDPTIAPTVSGSRSSNKNQLRIRFAEKINMNEHGIMTYASDNVLDFTNVSDLTAHYASNFETNHDKTGVLTMSQAEQVPAGEGLLLRGTANEIFYVPMAFGITPAAYTNNLMVGLTTATNVATTDGGYTNYILSKQNDVIGWYPLAAAYELKAHSAYLKLLTADVNAARGIVMDYGDGETTGIATITNDRESMTDDAWYTVDGKKLDEKPVKKGLYIHNGRKTVIK